MNNRLVIYFHYDPNGQADSACRFGVRAMRKQARAFLFVTNGTLQAQSRQWLEENQIRYLERENTGLDVGAYKAALQQVGRQAMDDFDEVILMNYTLAGPVRPLAQMFERMDARKDLDFWGLSRHYAMRSRRFGKRGEVPEHIQSHFIAVRRRMYADFWAYWQKIPLPGSYEDSIRFHESRFTAHFAKLGYRWDTFVDGDAWRGIFVNPIMACPRELIVRENCPFFKRRSFFTPYADELRRTDGRAAAELYAYLQQESDFPVDALIADLLPVQPLAYMAQNLHWHYLFAPANGVTSTPITPLTTPELAQGVQLRSDTLYSISLPVTAEGAAAWYERNLAWDPGTAAAALALFEEHAGLGVLGPALPLYPDMARAKRKQWQRNLPYLKEKLQTLQLGIPLAEDLPLPLPNGGWLLLRGAAFPDGIPPISRKADFWLLPLLAQKNGYFSATAESPEQAIARKDVYEAGFWPVQTVAGAGKLLARRIKHRLTCRKEGDE